jgi:tetratricopeptide (TPR) repeat protein
MGSNVVAEKSFAKGVESVTKGDFLSGLAYFEAAIELAKKVEKIAPPPKYLSFYGLCLAMVSTKSQTALELCESAVAVEFYNPDLFHNLARVHLRMGRRDRAYPMLLRGLQLHPSHRGILYDLRHLGVRRRPVLPFLSRGNPLNRLLGSLLRPEAQPLIQA